MLNDQTKSDVRRHLEYAVIGLWRSSPTGGLLAPMNNGMRWFNSYGNLEYKMNNLKPDEESRLMGAGFGAIGFNQGNPNYFLIPPVPSSSITVAIASTAFGGSSPITHTYNTTDTDTFLTICGAIAQQFANDPNYTSAGFQAINPFGVGPLGEPNNATQLVTFPLVEFIGPTPQLTSTSTSPVAVSFTITVSGTGSTIPQIINQGNPLSPSLTTNLTYPATKVWGYVPILNYLEDQMAGEVSDNLSVYKGNNATLRMSEMKDRQKLYKYYCRRMAVFLGIQMNPLADNFSHEGSGNWSCA